MNLFTYPVFLTDLVELGEELSIQTVQEQWVTILIEIEHLIPQYMRSCVTFLLEGLQVEGSLKMSDLLTGKLFYSQTNFNSSFNFLNSLADEIFTEKRKR